jgi:hypothetical protein
MTNDKQTAEEAAETWVNNNCSLYNPEDEANYIRIFLAGMKLAQEREKVLWTGWVQVDHDGKVVDPDSPIVDIEPWEVGKYVRVKLVEVPE